MDDMVLIGGIPVTTKELFKAGIRESEYPVAQEAFFREFFRNPNKRGYELSGVKVRNLLIRKLGELADDMNSKTGYMPGLGVLQIGDRNDSNTYVRLKELFADRAHFLFKKIKWEQGTTLETLLETIDDFDHNLLVHGMIVQSPHGFDVDTVNLAIPPGKDADCFNPFNVGMFYSGASYPVAPIPATPGGIELLFQAYGLPTTNEAGEPYDVLLGGRGDLAGKPMGRIASAAFNMTPALTNSRVDVKNKVSSGKYQVIISAIGGEKRETPIFTAEDIHRNTRIIIDIATIFGPNPDYTPGAKGRRGQETVQMGDFTEDAYKLAKIYAPSPGGAGPMTIARLLLSTFYLACQQTGYRPSGLVVPEPLVIPQYV